MALRLAQSPNAERRSREAILPQNGESCDWWGRRESNSHGLLHMVLNHARPELNFAVLEERFELSWISPHGPKPCASTSSATPAKLVRGKSANLPRTELCSGVGFRHVPIYENFNSIVFKKQSLRRWGRSNNGVEVGGFIGGAKNVFGNFLAVAPDFLR